MFLALLPFLVLMFLVLLPSLAHAAPVEFDALVERGWVLAYVGVFAAGVLTSLTPCVYPMIPIVMGVFGARGESVSRARALGLAAMYVLGMGLMYSSLGVAVALSGQAFGEILANPWVIVPLVGFYAVLATSMFGAFDLNLPSSLQSRLARVGGKGVGGAFAMGLVGGLTAAPCTGPILAGLLAYVATTHDVVLGFSLLFTYALGMGVLFFALAAFAIALPKSGAWMDGVKSIAVIALLVMGIYFLRPVWPAVTRLTHVDLGFLLACAGLALAGVVLGGVHLSFHDAESPPYRRRTLVILAALGVAAATLVALGLWRLVPAELAVTGALPVGVGLLTAAATLGTLRQRSAARARKAAGILLVTVGLAGVVNWVLTPKHPLPWRHDEAQVLAESRAASRPVLVDFGAEWCAPCKEYEVKLFADPAIYEELTSRFLPLKFDLTEETDEEFDAKDKYKAASLPTVILLRSDGTEAARFGEPLPGADEFLRALRAVR